MRADSFLPYYEALATDYDGTLATDGTVSSATIDALERWRGIGRRTLLVTGRRLESLASVCDRLDLFDRIVFENGALLFDPARSRETVLASRAPDGLVRALRERGVEPIAVGRVIIATEGPHDAMVLRAIRDLGLEHEVIFNKGSIMILPPGINKATGLRVALDELGISAERVVGVGDAENDHSFLAACGLAVAVANALPSLKAESDVVTVRAEGAGVAELISRLMSGDLSPAARSAVASEVGRGVDGASVDRRKASGERRR